MKLSKTFDEINYKAKENLIKKIVTFVYDDSKMDI
ncbi:hypothetical protein RCH13_002480 [Chryseobacterium sp. MP_3.2]|nr:hypothetical protein [Chryseobacterium sp. MP_3.2]